MSSADQFVAVLDEMQPITHTNIEQLIDAVKTITPTPQFPAMIPQLKTIFAISDIYTNCYDNAQKVFDSINWPDTKFLVLAGNIGCSYAFDILAKFLILCKKKYEHVIYVPGNHEYTNCKFDRASIDAKLEKLCYNCKVVYLCRNSVVIDGVRFIGDTLWNMTDIEKDGDIGNRIFEHRINHISAHVESFQFIQKELFASMDNPEPVVVVTGHTPTKKLLKPSDKKEEICYTDVVSDMQFVPNCKLWVCGNTLQSGETVLPNGLCVTNPVGCPESYSVGKLNDKVSSTVYLITDKLALYKFAKIE